MFPAAAIYFGIFDGFLISLDWPPRHLRLRIAYACRALISPLQASAMPPNRWTYRWTLLSRLIHKLAHFRRYFIRPILSYLISFFSSLLATGRYNEYMMWCAISARLADDV